MKRDHIIIIVVLLVAMIWRAPVVGVDPRTGAANIDIRLMFENAFVWATLAALAYFIATRVNLWFGLFLVLASFSAWFPVNSEHSEKAHMMVLYGVIWFFLCVQFLNTKKARGRILNTICVIALINVLMLFMQGFINFDPIHNPIAPTWASGGGWDRVPNVGLMDHQNSVSAMLAFSWVAFVRKGWIWCLIPVTVGFVLAKTFAGPLAVAISIPFSKRLYVDAFPDFILKFKDKLPKGRFLVPLLCLMALYGYYLKVDKPDTPWRYRTLEVGTTLLKQHWIFGSGIGHWQDVFASSKISNAITGYIGKRKEFMAQAHNDPFQMFFEMGIGSVIILFGYLISIFRRYRKAALRPMIAFVIVAIDSMAFFPFHIALLGMLALTWMAILEKNLKPVRPCFVS